LIPISSQRSNYDAAKLSCCDRGKQCYRLCRTAYTNEFFTESEELDNCLAHPNEAALATCLDNGSILIRIPFLVIFKQTIFEYFSGRALSAWLLQLVFLLKFQQPTNGTFP